MPKQRYAKDNKTHVPTLGTANLVKEILRNVGTALRDFPEQWTKVCTTTLIKNENRNYFCEPGIYWHSAEEEAGDMQ